MTTKIWVLYERKPGWDALSVKVHYHSVPLSQSCFSFMVPLSIHTLWPLKSHILPCLAKEHFLSVWTLSLPPRRPSQWETLSFDIGDGVTGRTTSTLGHHVSHNRSKEQKCIEAS